MKKGFTLAEVLITLAIIGIVAAITIPTLMADVNQKAFDNQRKTLHSRLANALSAMDRLNGYGIYDNSDPDNVQDTAAESFIVDGLSKVYKIRNVCTFEKRSKCGLSDSFTSFTGESIDYPDSIRSLYVIDEEVTNTNAMVFETNNGESIITYYNPKCAHKGQKHKTLTCANFIYDLNGPKPPNMMGKDVGFITAFYKEDPAVVAPMIDEKSIDAGSASSIDAADKCAELGDDYRLPTVLELVSVALNSFGGTNITINADKYWSSDIVSPGGTDGQAYMFVKQSNNYGFTNESRSAQHNIMCVKR